MHNLSEYTFDYDGDTTTHCDFSQETGGQRIVGLIVVISLTALVALVMGALWL